MNKGTRVHFIIDKRLQAGTFLYFFEEDGHRHVAVHEDGKPDDVRLYLYPEQVAPGDPLAMLDDIRGRLAGELLQGDFAGMRRGKLFTAIDNLRRLLGAT